MTLKEYKQDIRDQIRAMKDVVKDLKSEHCGIDKLSGHYGETGKYKMKLQLETEIDLWKTVLSQVNKITRMR